MRTQKVLKHRMISIGGRVLRIRMLRRIDHRAGRLFNTGAYPQGTYGKEGMGVNPSLMTHMRAQAACAVSTCTKGQCPTTLIWLGLGREQDPAIKVPCDQIRMWLYLAPQADQVLISKAWWRMKIDFYTSGMPWSKVKGPLEQQ